MEIIANNYCHIIVQKYTDSVGTHRSLLLVCCYFLQTLHLWQVLDLQV